jgi:hypothetical protein
MKSKTLNNRAALKRQAQELDAYLAAGGERDQQVEAEARTDG